MFLQLNVFGIIYALWEILWTFEKYRDTGIDYQQYDSIGENIKSTTDAYKCIFMMYLHCIALDLP